jgi:hypothetical protein
MENPAAVGEQLPAGERSTVASKVSAGMRRERAKVIRDVPGRATAACA